MIDAVVRDEIGKLLDKIACGDYEAWENYWADRNCELEHIVMLLEDWEHRCEMSREETPDD